MRVVYMACMMNVPHPGSTLLTNTFNPWVQPIPTVTFGQKVLDLNPHLLIMHGDTPYVDNPADSVLTGPQPISGFNGTLFASEITADYFRIKYLAFWDCEQYAPLLQIPNIWYMPDDHDTFDNDYTHSVASTMTAGTGTQATNQEECNAKQAEFVAGFQSIVQNNASAFQSWYETNYSSHANSADAYDFTNIGNPASPNVAAEVPPWVVGIVKDPSGNNYNNPDYSNFAGRPSAVLSGGALTSWNNAHHPVIYFSAGYRYGGTRDDVTPDIKFICLDAIMRRDRTEEWEEPIPPYPLDQPNVVDERVRKCFGNTQWNWAKSEVENFDGDWLVLSLGKMFFQLETPQANPDGLMAYTVERDAILSWLATNVTQNLIILGGDRHHPHIVNFIPGTVFESPNGNIAFPNGIAQICSSVAARGGSNVYETTHVPWAKLGGGFAMLDFTPEKVTATMYAVGWSPSPYYLGDNNVDGIQARCVATMMSGDMHFTVRDMQGNVLTKNASRLGFK